VDAFTGPPYFFVSLVVKNYFYNYIIPPVSRIKSSLLEMEELPMMSLQGNGNMAQRPYYHNSDTQNDWVLEHAPLTGAYQIDYEFLRSHVKEYPKTFAHYVAMAALVMGII
jgi:hypothetical protein